MNANPNYRRSRLFPNRAQIGSTDYGLDADHHDHSSDDTPQPEMTVTDPDVIGQLWSPCGTAYRIVMDGERVEFGFQARPKQ